MYKKFRGYIVWCLLLAILLYNFSYGYCNNNYEYIYGTNNLLLIGKNDKSKPYYNFFIILTIDSVNNKLTLTSINKDIAINKDESIYEMYLNTDEGYLVSVLKDKFNINIDNYVVIDSLALCKIVDTTKTIKLEDNLASGLNILNFLESKKCLSSYEQEKFQLHIIQELLYGFSRLPFSSYPYVIKETFPYVKLNITPFKMLSLGFTALRLKNYTANKVQY